MSIQIPQAIPRSIGAIVTGTPTGTVGMSPTTAILPTIVYDSNSAYDTGTGIYTIPKQGLYVVSSCLSISFSSASNSAISVQIVQNGSNILTFPFLRITSTLNASPLSTIVYYFNLSDQVIVQCYSEASGSAFSTNGSFFTIGKLP